MDAPPSKGRGSVGGCAVPGAPWILPPKESDVCEGGPRLAPQRPHFWMGPSAGVFFCLPLRWLLPAFQPALPGPAKTSRGLPSSLPPPPSFPFAQGHLEALRQASSEWLKPVWPPAGQFLRCPHSFCAAVSPTPSPPHFRESSSLFPWGQKPRQSGAKGRPCQEGEDTCGSRSPFPGVSFGLEDAGCGHL